MNAKPRPEISLSNDVEVIRNILLGEHLERFQDQVEALEKEISALKRENKALLKELETEHEKRFQQLAVRLEQLKNEQGESGQHLRADLITQIEEVSRRLAAHENQQGGLIASLANALQEYRDQAGE